MSKRSKKNQEEIPEGMSRRQAKLAKRAAEREAMAKDRRPFAGLALEPDLVALQIFVPSAVAQVPINGSERTVKIVTVLPGAVAAVVRATEGGEEALVAMQVQSKSDNPGRDLAYALDWATKAEVGQTLTSGAADGTQPQLTSLIAADALPEIDAYQDFSWWTPKGETPDAGSAQMIRRAEDTIIPSYRVDAEIPGAAWWVHPGGDKAHIRWIRTDDNEEKVQHALARIAARGELNLGDNTKFAGVFRTHGLVVPVWDLDPARNYADYAGDLAKLDRAIAAELDNDAQLSAEERKQLQNIKSRQVTVR